MAKHYRRLVAHSNLILAFFFPLIPARVIPGKYFHLLPPLSWLLFLVSVTFFLVPLRVGPVVYHVYFSRFTNHMPRVSYPSRHNHVLTAFLSRIVG